MQPRTLSVAIAREDDRYVAQCLEVDVSSFDANQEEAIARATEALEPCFEDVPVAERIEHPVPTSVDLRVPA